MCIPSALRASNMVRVYFGSLNVGEMLECRKTMWRPDISMADKTVMIP